MKTLLTCFDSEAKSSLWPAIEGQSSEAIKELPFRQTADDRQKEESLTAKKKKTEIEGSKSNCGTNWMIKETPKRSTKGKTLNLHAVSGFVKEPVRV